MYTFYLILQEQGLPPLMFKTTIYINNGLPKLTIIGNISQSIHTQSKKILSILKHFKLLKFKQILIELQDIDIKYTNPVYIDILLYILIGIFKAKLSNQDKKLKDNFINNIIIAHKTDISIYEYLYFDDQSIVSKFQQQAQNIQNIQKNSNQKQYSKVNYNNFLVYTKNLQILDINTLDYLNATLLFKKLNSPLLNLQIFQLPCWLILNLTTKPMHYLSTEKLLKAYLHQFPGIHHIQEKLKTAIQATQDFLVHQNQLNNPINNINSTPIKLQQNIPLLSEQTINFSVLKISYPLILMSKITNHSNVIKISQSHINNKILFLNMPTCKCANFLSKEARCVCSTRSLLNYYNKFITPLLNKSITNTVFINNNMKNTYSDNFIQKTYSQTI